MLNLFEELWHRENDPDDEVDLIVMQQRDCYVASVHETGGDKPVCEEPKTPSLMMNADGTTSMTRVASCSTTHLSIIRELGVWEVVDRPCDEVVFGTRWVDINKEDETKTVLECILHLIFTNILRYTNGYGKLRTSSRTT